MRRYGILLTVASLLAFGAAAQPYELDGYTAQRFALQRLKIVDRTGMGPVSLVVPTGWTSERDAKDKLWLIAPDRSHTAVAAQIAVAHHGDPDGKRANLVQVARRKLEELGGHDLRSIDDRTRTLVEGRYVAGSGDRRAVSHTLMLIWSDARDVHASGFDIHVRRGEPDRSDTPEIVGLFRAQLLRGALAPPPSVLDRLPPRRAEDRHDFRSLRPAAPFGFMSLQVPSKWGEEDDGEVVGYYDPRPGSPELWIGYHIVIRHNDRDGAVYRKTDAPYLRENKRDDRRRIQWMISDSTEDRAMILIVDLFIEERDVDRPEFKELVQIVDEQLRRMRIGRPPADKEATIEMGKRPEKPKPPTGKRP